MTVLSPEAQKQFVRIEEIARPSAALKTCELAMEALHVTDLSSVEVVLIGANEWLQRFINVETDYLEALKTDSKHVRNDDEDFERLSELNMIHSHFDVCATVLGDHKTDELHSVAQVLIGAASELFCVYSDWAGLDKFKEVA